MDTVPIPPEARAVLDWWRPRITELLGDSLRGARLFGGIPLGGFEPRWSDLDVCTLLAAPVDGALAEAIGRLHDELEERFLRSSGTTWKSTQCFEGPYVPEDLAARPGARARCLVVGTGRRELSVCDPVPGFERLMLARCSIPVLGEPARFVPDAAAAIARHLEWLPGLLGPDAEAHSSIMLAGILQELARTIVYLRDGRLVSKDRALEEEIEAGGPFSAAYAVALRVRRTGSARADEHRTDLIEAWAAVAASAREEVERLRKTPGVTFG